MRFLSALSLKAPWNWVAIRLQYPRRDAWGCSTRLAPVPTIRNPAGGQAGRRLAQISSARVSYGCLVRLGSTARAPFWRTPTLSLPRIALPRTAKLVLSALAVLALGGLLAAHGVAQPLAHSSAAAAGQVAAQAPAGGEAQLTLPDLNQGTFLGTSGRVILMWGLIVCALGLLFGFITYSRLRDLPVHTSMREVSELIWETCKTYLQTQGKFLLALEALIAVILAFSVLGILGSYSVAWYGIRVNTFANSRTAFASLKGKPFPCYAIPLRAGMSIGMVLISIELTIMLCILLFIPGDYAG